LGFLVLGFRHERQQGEGYFRAEKCQALIRGLFRQGQRLSINWAELRATAAKGGNLAAVFAAQTLAQNLPVFSSMRMTMDMAPAITEEENQRRREIYRQRRREDRAQWLANLRRQFFRGVRNIFVFLLGATVVVLVLSHLSEINSIATQKAGQLAAAVKSHADASKLKQGSLTFDKEVNEITK
jgi:hypothetical protein